MTTISISDARAELSEAISKAKKKPVTISRHGKPIAVLVNPSMYEKLVEAMEELEDIEDFDSSVSKADQTIPWEQAKRDLGLL